ncbi:MAG TPA: alkaline phosphatase family protein [Thermoanaerobaculia bacterium]
MARASRNLGRIALALLASSPVPLLDCAPAAAPRRATREAQPIRRAVLVSFDGVAGERLERLLADPPKLPAGAFRRLAARGFHAVRSLPPTPSLTAVSHVTHVTGALPEVTGIVSNLMLDFSKPFPATISGFDAPIRAETLWQAARRQGKRVGVMLYPGADGSSPDRTADWMMTWPGDPVAPGRLRSLARTAWVPAGPSEAPPSFSPVRRTTLSFVKTSHSIRLLALDGTDDGRVDYDRLLVLPEKGQRREVRVGEWFSVEVASADGRAGSWCKLLALSPDLSKAEIYVGPLSRSTGVPREWVRTLDEQVGFWPGAPDTEAFGAESGRSEIFLEQTERLVDFLTRADLLALSRRDWDLLLIYQPEVDETSHEFFLIDPRQPRFTPERSARFVHLVDQSYALADRSLDAIEKSLSPADSLFVTSDHGMTAIWGEISINEILREAGLVRLDAEKNVAASSPLAGISASGISHVYANPAGAPGALDRAEQVLKDFRVRGESPFDRIVRREDAEELGLRAPESGDLIVLAKPGFLFTKKIEKGVPVGERRDYGGHGYRNVYPELDATFFAAGPGIPPSRADTIGSWEIAALVARALGVDPPRNAARR